MAVFTTAFSIAFLAHIGRMQRTALASTQGDRYLFAGVVARLYVSRVEGRSVSATKLALEAESLGLSHRSATRMCRHIVQEGLATEHPQGRAKMLRATDKLMDMWDDHIENFVSDLTEAGVTVTK